jgi:hypothetical protein
MGYGGLGGAEEDLVALKEALPLQRWYSYTPKR